MTPELQSQLDDLTNRIAAESMFVQPGSDEGLLPVYSLFAELLGLAPEQSQLHVEVTKVQAAVEELLDTAQPFSPGVVGKVRKVVAKFPEFLKAAIKGEIADVMVPDETAAAAAAVPTESAAEPPGTAAAEGEVETLVDPSVDQMLDLNMEENAELLTEFHAEAIDHLQQIEAALLTLDAAPGDRDALNSLFRSFHTIKGVSGFLHLTPMHTLTHEVESLLDLARNGRLVLTGEIITEILKSRDAVQEMVQQVTVALESGRLPDRVIPVSFLMNRVIALARAGEVAQKEAKPAQPSTAPQAASAPIAAAPAPAAAVVPKPAPANKIVSMPGAAAQAPQQPPRVIAASTVRVNTEKLDSLMDVVGELVIVQSQLQESAKLLGVGGDATAMTRNLAQLGRITKDLQLTAMSLRMVPIKPTFQRMERLVRDLSREFGKQIVFQTSGEDTEIDRTVVEEIADPLVHMVRNSLDHGLETPEERRAVGKVDTGVVRLGAYHEGSSLIIELSDDGRGIDPQKILAKAISKGLVTEGAPLTGAEIFNLIFLPGFSTAEKVTSVSGRGVGMDVVKRNIEHLRGQIHIESKLGQGSTFRIRLPLTTAIIDGLLVRVGADRFILPSTMVQQALRPTQSALARIQGRGEALDHRGHILPLHRLHERFGIADAIVNPTEGIVVIVENAGRTYGLLVDELLNKQEVVVKNLGGFLSNLPGVSGGAILGDGNIALILDTASLCSARIPA